MKKKAKEIRRRARRNATRLVKLFETLFQLHGHTFPEVGRRLGWPEGRAETLLTEPWKLEVRETQELCRALGVPMSLMIELLLDPPPAFGPGTADPRRPDRKRSE